LKSLENRYIVKRTNIIRGVDVDTRKTENTPKMKPYDDIMWEQWSMYDAMPYIWDPDLNVERVFKCISGNVIKYYRIQMDDPYMIKHE
jgi:hypothetical protein